MNKRYVIPLVHRKEKIDKHLFSIEIDNFSVLHAWLRDQKMNLFISTMLYYLPQAYIAYSFIWRDSNSHIL